MVSLQLLRALCVLLFKTWCQTLAFTIKSVETENGSTLVCCQTYLLSPFLLGRLNACKVSLSRLGLPTFSTNGLSTMSDKYLFPQRLSRRDFLATTAATAAALAAPQVFADEAKQPVRIGEGK